MHLNARHSAVQCMIRTIVALSCAVVVLIGVPTTALAKETHILLSTFPTSNGLGAIGGLAVDNSHSTSAGDIWVADQANALIDRFDTSGEDLLFKNDGSETPQGSFAEGSLQGLAVDPSNGDLYISESSQGLVDKLNAVGEYLSQISAEDIPEEKEGQKQIGHPGIGAPFAPSGIAVDPVTSNLFIGNEGSAVIDVFGSDGEYLYQFRTTRPAISIAIDTNDNVFAGTIHGVEVYEALTGLPEGILEESSKREIDALVAVERGSDDVYVAHANGNDEVKQYEAWNQGPGELVTTFTNGEHSGGIGIGQTNSHVYVAGMHDVSIFGPLIKAAEPATEQASEVTTESAVLNGVVNPNGLPVEECYFEYGTTEAYGHIADCEPEAKKIPTPEGEYHVSAKIKIEPNTVYHFRLVAKNENAKLEGSDEAISVPVVEADSVHTVNGEGRLSVFGVVNPDGSETSYSFEFLTEKQYEEGDWADAISNEEQRELGATTGGELVIEPTPAKLLPGVTYRFRVSAKSKAYPEAEEHSSVKTLVVSMPGPEVTAALCPNVAERTGSSVHLPDCRAYEQVTPIDKEGAQDNFDYGKSATDVIVGSNGERLLMNTASKWGQNVSGGEKTTYVFTRGEREWGMSSLSPQPQTEGVSNVPAEFYTPALSQVLVEQQWHTSVNAASLEVEFTLGPPGGPYTLVASEPQEHFTVPGPEHGEDEVRHEGHWAAQSRDGSVAVIESPDHKLIPSLPTGTTAPVAALGGQGNQGYDLYEYSGGQLRQVNVAPEPNGKKTIGTCGAELAQGREGGGLRGSGQESEFANTSLETGSVNAISENGSRIFFEAFPTGCPTIAEEIERRQGAGGPKFVLYMYVDGERTVEIGHYTFEGANPEGTQLFLSKKNGSITEFFAYDTETMTATPLFSLGSAGFGAKHALSENGEVFYFETYETLTPEAPPAGPKIYRYDIPTKTMTFVAASSTSQGVGGGGFFVSPEGKDFYFNVESVKGVSGSGGELHHVVEVYRYDSSENMVQCMSCASPYDPEPREFTTFMPQFGPSINRRSPLGSPASANGDFVFFDTPAALLPQDINGEISPQEFLGENNRFFSPSSDVYEWRRNGVEGCSRVQGCLALITNGINGTENVLLGTDPSGRDVFFTTHSQLAPTDTDTAGDVYDARIGGGSPPPPPPETECEGDACSVPPIAPFDPPQELLPPPTPPAAATPSATAGSSAGAPRCGRGLTLAHGRCVKATKTKKAKRSKAARGKSARSSGRRSR